jgi:hypothetical protein
MEQSCFANPRKCRPWWRSFLQSLQGRSLILRKNVSQQNKPSRCMKSESKKLAADLPADLRERTGSCAVEFPGKPGRNVFHFVPLRHLHRCCFRQNSAVNVCFINAWIYAVPKLLEKTGMNSGLEKSCGMAKDEVHHAHVIHHNPRRFCQSLSRWGHSFCARLAPAKPEFPPECPMQT